VITLHDLAPEPDSADDGAGRVLQCVQRTSAGMQTPLAEDRSPLHPQGLPRDDDGRLLTISQGPAQLAALIEEVPPSILQHILCHITPSCPRPAPQARDGGECILRTTGAV